MSLEPLRRLLHGLPQARLEDLPALAVRVAPLLGATALALYLVDHRQRELVPLTGPGAPPREPFAVDGTVGGRAYTTTGPCAVSGPDGPRLWLPLLDGGERLGVLEVASAVPLGDAAAADCATAAALLAELVVTRTAYGDTAERLRRREPMGLAAELLRAQLPPLTSTSRPLTVSGILEPAYDVGGDAFDHAVNGDTGHLALFDAAGHGSAGGTRSVVLASLALAAYRNARRAGWDLPATYHHIDAAVRAHQGRSMVTAVLAELDLRTGALLTITAGHPGGVVLRRGRVVRELPAPTALPVPLGDRRAPVVVREALEPGDRVLLYTDGVVEARSPGGEQFGLDRLVDFAVRGEADRLPLPETTRRLVHAILAHQDGELQDDATVLLAEWHGPDGG